MIVNNRLYDFFADKGERVTVELLLLGLGYTAVTTSDGGIGLSYTYFDRKTSCSLVRDYCDYEGSSPRRIASLLAVTVVVSHHLEGRAAADCGYSPRLSRPVYLFIRC